MIREHCLTGASMPHTQAAVQVVAWHRLSDELVYSPILGWVQAMEAGIGTAVQYYWLAMVMDANEGDFGMSEIEITGDPCEGYSHGWHIFDTERGQVLAWGQWFSPDDFLRAAKAAKADMLEYSERMEANQ